MGWAKIKLAIEIIYPYDKAQSRPSAGWAKVDRWEGTVLMGTLLTPRFAPTALSSEG